MTSVDDSLPPDTDQVLAFDKHDGFVIAHYDADDDSWETGSGWTLRFITHWMILPPNPLTMGK